MKAWITIDNTHIDYPVLQGKDDMEYVNKDPFGEFALSGSIFLSTKNASDFSDVYNMTYGHHMENGAMFGDLTKMLDLKYLKDDVAVSLLKHSFDASAIDIYSSLLNGGTLVLIPKEDEFNAKEVVETIRKNNVTRLFTVHKWIEQIQNVCIENNIKLDKLRIIGTGAEV